MKSYIKTEWRDGQNSWRQKVVGLLGLLLLTLLAANPLQALAQTAYITSSDGGGINLDSSYPAYHSVSVNSGVSINYDLFSDDAIQGSTRAWRLVNNGTLTGYYRGVEFGLGGSVNNTYYISGGYDGIDFEGAPGSVINSGDIVGSDYDGIYFNNGGSVSNLSSGYIFGGGYAEGGGAGVEIYGGSGLVNNAGTIESYTGLDGVYMDQGGTVNNGGYIYGSGDGVDIFGGGLVVNTGTINGTNGPGVYINGSIGIVTNSGTIGSAYGNGVELDANGVVNNLSGGYIYGGLSGVVMNSGGTVINDGQIYGYFGAGVYMNGGGSVYNQGIGYISGFFDGVDVYGGSGAVYNFGASIVGQIGDGVYMDQGGVVSNLNGGSITGYYNGVEMNGGPGAVYNFGSSIVGQTSDGVYMDQGGIVVNKNTWSWDNGLTPASIEGGVFGVEINGGFGIVTNSGSITGDTQAGVKLSDGGIVVNEKHGFIGGNSDGIDITDTNGPSFVSNAGTIIGTNGTGVLMAGGGGIVINQASQHHGNNWGYGDATASANASQAAFANNENIVPTIEGGRYGVIISDGPGMVINSGTIIGITNAGVLLTDGGTVVNQTSERHGNYSGYNNESTLGYNGNTVPTISGGNNGVLILGDLGFVTNSGSISGGTVAGVWLADGGIVVNQASQRHGNYSGNDSQPASAYYGKNIIPTITGGDWGVLISGSTNAVVINSGTIIGTNGAGVLLTLGGTVVNQGQGRNWGYNNLATPAYYENNNIPTIMGGNNGVNMNIFGGTNGVVINSGLIMGVTNDGVLLHKGGSVYNDRHGTISGGANGVEITGGSGYIDNYGTITGDNGTAIKLDSYSGNEVDLESRSEVYGNIVGGGTDDAAYLYGRGEYGDYTYGYGFTNFSTLNVYADSHGWDLTGTNFFFTSATVNEGLLRVNGQLNSPYVYVDGILGGSGVINGEVDIESGGTLSPGNSPGIITINGPLNFNGYSTYEVDVRPQTNDLTVVNGTATLQTNASVYVKLPFWNQWTSDKAIFGSNTVYTILASTNLIGQFNSNVVFNTSMLFLTPSLSYDSTNGYLDLKRLSFTVEAKTFNQNSVAGALDGIVNSTNATPAMSNLVSEVFWMGSPSEVQAALDSLSGAIHGTLGLLDVQQQDAFNNSIALRTGRMSAGGGNGGYASSLKPVQLANAGSTLPPMQQAQTNLLDLWLQGFATYGNLGNDGNALGGDYYIHGVSGGLDYRLTPKLLAGLALGYSHDYAEVGGPGQWKSGRHANRRLRRLC